MDLPFECLIHQSVRTSFIGEQNGYFWVEWNDRSAFLRDLLKEVPEIVVGKYLVNTSLDSGPLSRSAEEIEKGWRRENSVAFSTRITSVEEIPFDQYDEWYVFDTPSAMPDHEVFVNYGGFSLQSDVYARVAERFWQQISIVEPLTYLSEGDNLICVTKHKHLRELLSAWPSS